MDEISTTACCNAGSNAPNLSSNNLSNVCPATTADLASLTASNSPFGANLEWHSATPVNANNKINALNVGAGTYYAVFFDAVNNCYSATTAATMSATSCSGVSAGMYVISVITAKGKMSAKVLVTQE